MLKYKPRYFNLWKIKINLKTVINFNWINKKNNKHKCYLIKYLWKVKVIKWKNKKIKDHLVIWNNKKIKSKIRSKSNKNHSKRMIKMKMVQWVN
jgi:hypothetical protein